MGGSTIIQCAVMVRERPEEPTRRRVLAPWCSILIQVLNMGGKSIASVTRSRYKVEARS